MQNSPTPLVKDGASEGVASSVFSSGLRQLAQAPWLIVGLWLLSVGASLFATQPLRAMLRETLAFRPIAERLATGQYDVGFFELLSDNRAAMGAIAAAMVGAAALYLLLQAAISGGILSRLSPPNWPGHVQARQFAKTSAETAGRMLKMDLLFLLVVRLPMALLFSTTLGFAVGWKKISALSWPTLAGRLALVGLCFLVCWCLSNVWLTFSRLHTMGQPNRSSWRAFCAGFSTLTRSGRRIFGNAVAIALVSLVVHAVLVYVGRLVTFRLDARLLVLTAFVTRQVVSFLRTGLSLWLLAAACSLFQKAELGQGQPPGPQSVREDGC